jgi:protein-tyrosine-phosphatase
MHPHTVLVMAGLGAVPADSSAQQLTAALPAQADLILTMTRHHRHDVLAAAPRALARTFTLREAAALLQLVDDAMELSGDAFADRARSLVKEPAAARTRRQGKEDDDIRDPIGHPIEVHQEVGRPSRSPSCRFSAASPACGRWGWRAQWA